MTRAQIPAGEFAERAEPMRRELLAHCYRMLGSVQDAEDVVQETYLKAWRGYAGFDGRASLSTWLYRIATNTCLSTLRHSSRRVLPSGLGAPGEDPSHAPVAAAADVTWLQPMPDALVTPESEDPAVVAELRESLRLALIACLQHLTPRQRAVFVLREVLSFPAAEVAELLGTSVAAVKSTLQRARARLDSLSSASEAAVATAEPVDRELLEAYVAAFENADGAAFARLLRTDATLEFPPAATWFSGRASCVPLLTSVVGEPADWRMLPSTANGQPAAVSYRRDEQGVHRAFGVAVLTTTPSGIARVVAFGDPALVGVFGCPPTLPEHPPTRPEPHGGAR
ncbi:MAG: sigma-70 family RNA polymerase sigma factor [Micromonosporaceae bacterium]